MRAAASKSPGPRCAAGMARALASVRDQLVTASDQAGAAPGSVRDAYGAALRAVDRALEAARDDDSRLGSFVESALGALDRAQAEERRARQAAIRGGLQREEGAAP